MKATIYPSTASGVIDIPTSKSMAHRAIICAALAEGITTIHDVYISQDIEATLQAIHQLGATYIWKGNQIEICGGGAINKDKVTIECKESGSTMRFLIPLLSILTKEAYLYGKESLLKRPQDVYSQMFCEQDLLFHQTSTYIHIKGSLQARTYDIQGNMSSQFISGLLFALPLLPNESCIKIQAPLESKSYIDMTLDMIQQFGISIIKQDEYTFYIPGSQQYKATELTIEKDFSQAAFFAVLGAINGNIHLPSLNLTSLQGDRVIFTILKQWQAQISCIQNNYQIQHSNVESHPIDLQDCPDLGPILCVLACFATQATRFIHTKRLAYKESNRMQAMQAELAKVGVIVKMQEDEITVYPNNMHSACLQGHHDHRIVMALSILATTLLEPTVIEGVEAVQKSYPTFFDDLKKCGIKVILKS